MEFLLKEQEQELLDGYRKLRPESQRFIMSTLVTAVAATAYPKLDIDTGLATLAELVSISGTAEVGQTLTASAVGLNGSIWTKQ